MVQRILSSLSWKAGVAAAAFALAAGTGATTVHLVNASSADDTPAVTSTDTHGVSAEHGDEHADDKGDNADDQGDDAAKTATANTNTTEHPDNFGAVVSADAKDGGVDGQTISDMAHAKNEANTHAENDAADDDHGKADDDHGKADEDHGAEADTHADDDGSDD